LYYSHFHKDSYLKTGLKPKNVLLIGAGKTGDKISRELLTSFRSVYEVIGFADDNPLKIGAMLHGKKILCKISEIPELTIQFDEIIIASPSASAEKMRLIISACKESNKPYKIVPSFNDLIDKEMIVSTIRNVSYVDLLGRSEIKLDMNSIDNMLHGKRILITGAGGSIGSELVKQSLKYNPSEIICFDQGEEKIFNLEQELNRLSFKDTLKYILGDINNRNELKKVFSENRPNIVFHAAAYKHVPIQELHPWAAVKTNIGGSLNIMELSNDFDVDKFILVSTDKAVNPVNIMGATKKIAEYMVQSINANSKTQFMAVRFGNVLGSSGSAIPIFEKQIKLGGPVTITHPEMTRYFMSLQEASQLIIQCGALGKEGEIFLLDMGKPIKILQMAKDLIKLSGFDAEIDIPIVYTGLRPGEKLYEELQLTDEIKLHTNHKKIMILKSKTIHHNWQELKNQVNQILVASKELDTKLIKLLLHQIAPTYKPLNNTESKPSNLKFNNRSSFKAEA
tara:strand:- start:2515 stop:4041 length:1527 start_codon:yes stop_codon:yes gene_type:complete